MFGFDENAPLLTLYLYQTLASSAVVWIFWGWIEIERGALGRDDPERAALKLLLLGIVLLNLSVAAQSVFFGSDRIIGLGLKPGLRIGIIVTLRLVVVAATYLHIHAALMIRYGRHCPARRWLAWGVGLLIPFILLSFILS